MALELRDFHDVPATRKAIYKNVLSAAATLPPVSNARHTLHLTDVHYADPADRTPADTKKAILAGGTLGRRLRGTWVLKDLAGKELQRKQQTIAVVPHLSDDGTFVHRGTEYAMRNQLRLLPGIYHRSKANGEIEAHINPQTSGGVGTGFMHRYQLDPAKGIFYAEVRQARIPLMPLLKTLGATDKQLQDSWGTDIWHANASKTATDAISKFHARFVRTKTPPTNDFERRQQLKEAVEAMRLDPAVMQRTLGKPHENLNVSSILDSTKKLLAISRGEAETDDRDSLANQQVVGPEDILAERLRKDSGGLRRLLLNKASFRNGLDSIPAGALTSQLEHGLLHAGVTTAVEESNPLDVLDKHHAFTRMGEGGIASSDAIPRDARSVHPSHLNFVDVIRSPESLRIGVDLYFAAGAKKGDDGRIYAPFKDPKTGRTEYKSPQDLADAKVTFPGELEKGRKHVPVIHNSRLSYVRRRDVDYVVPDFEHSFSPLGQLVPFKSAAKGGRMSMASRMLQQALPLVNPEAPLVRSGRPGGGSFEQHYGQFAGALRAKQHGIVTHVSPDKIQVQYQDGSQQTHLLHIDRPYNRKTLTTQTPVVQPGQRIQPGGLLAKSNFTDHAGTLALGKNLRTVYLSNGMNHEDAVVLSESAAKKLTAEQAYQHTLDYHDLLKTGKRTYQSLFGGKYDKPVLDTLDEEGIIKPGQTVTQDHPLILAGEERPLLGGKATGKKQTRHHDATVTWEHSFPGTVTDVAKTKTGVNVVIRGANPLQLGDKVSNRFGGKGIVAQVLPDAQMPHDKEGNPYEVIQNPLGLITRGNPAMVVEAALGKLAAKHGKPYELPDWQQSADDLVKFAHDELRRHGMSDITEDVYDPHTGRKIPGVAAGHNFFLRLHHNAEDKAQAHSLGQYTQFGEPAKGGDEGSAQRTSLGEVHALMAHGALGVLKDAGLHRGGQHDDYWLKLMQGHSPPEPEIPVMYQKLVHDLLASGINVIPRGTKTHLMALTNKDIQQQAGSRVLRNAETLRMDKDQAAIEGGLFDRSLFGEGGEKWARLPLAEPMPNPIMLDPIKHTLGMTTKELEGVLLGKEKLPDGSTGPTAILAALERVNVPREMALARARFGSSRGAARDSAVRKYRALSDASRQGLHPRDWMWDNVPVLPSKFRPISVLKDTNTPIVSDPNYLYHSLFDANANLASLTGRVDDVANERQAVLDSLKAVVGLGDPVQAQHRQKGVRGILKHLAGSSPKYSILQRRLLSTKSDLVGRATVAPNPDIGMDEVGIPEDKAWISFQPFIVRRLTRSGMSLGQAIRSVKERSPEARTQLVREMDEHPVYVNRAPILHKFGVLGLKPKLIAGNALQMSPLVCQGLNLDFDGDSCIASTICTLTLSAEAAKLPGMSFAETESVCGAGGEVFARCCIADFPRVEASSRTDSKGIVHYDVPRGIKVLSYDPATGLPGFHPVTELTVHPRTAGFSVVLSDGTVGVGASADHSLYVYDVTRGMLQRTRPQDALGKAVPVIRHIVEREIIHRIALPKDILAGEHPERRTKAYAHEPATSIAADFYFGWWLGASASDAWTDAPAVGVIHYAKASAALRKAFRAGCGRLCPGLTGYRSRKTRHVDLEMGLDAISVKTSFCSAPLARLFKHWFSPAGNRAQYKQLPPFLVSLPENCLWGVLSGLIDGDSGVRINIRKHAKPQFSCVATTVSPQLRDDILLLGKLLSLRITATPYTRPGRQTAYALAFSTVDLYRCRQHVKLRDPAKRRVWNKMLKVTKDDRDLVPVPVGIAAALIPVLGALRDPSYTLAFGARRGKLVSRATGKRWLSILQKDGRGVPGFGDWAALVGNECIGWRTVKALQPLEAQTMYDLTVPGTEVFAVNNGLIVYDSMAFHVPSTPEAIEDVKRMFPSHNLLSPADFKTPVSMPRQEFAGGLWRATEQPDEQAQKKAHYFATQADAIASYKRGEISASTPVRIAS